ncbi:T9SS type A sorting domain-containing protein [Flavobacterium sp.]|uniref:T9SS type A sorting domain-containing protein n=1 Tax=Flavobacterium sp. TaxID=239 RepID=UPI00286DB37B|nr:T9SS type A sorting domain-containing protein [Flavobacterium sp.]
MKNLLYFFCTVCMISNAKAQTINFPDKNLKARLLKAEIGNGIAYQQGGSFKIDSNNDNEIQVSEALLVNDLVLYNCGISDLGGLEYFTNLTHLNCANNTISKLDLSTFPKLVGFDAYNNRLTSLNVSNLTVLTNFSCLNNQITSLLLSNLPKLLVIRCENNLLTTLSVNNLPNLSDLFCNNNMLSTLDTSNLTQLGKLNCASNRLNTLYIINNSIEAPIYLDFSNNPNLEYVCADDFQLTQVQEKITEYGYSNCYTNSYCSFVPGGNFYTANGSIKYDETSDGCDVLDIAFPNLKLSMSNGTNTGNVFGNSTGNYTYTVPDGTYTMQPVLDNPTYFTIFPTSVDITFPTQASPYSQNFCVTPNGSHPDLDINLSQMNWDYTAMPGSNNTYKIIYKNKGTNTQSGTINFSFDDAVTDYVYSNPSASGQSVNTLVWNFSNLKPFESREIQVILHFNSDTDLPPVNDGDLFAFTSSINTVSIDETPNDNTFILNQVASSLVLLNNVTNTLDNNFIVYPNPTTNTLYIENKSAKKESIKVYNSIGQLVININEAEKITALDVTPLNTGNYFIIIQTEKGIYKRKFIKN